MKKIDLLITSAIIMLMLEPVSRLFSQVGKELNRRGVELGRENRLDQAIQEFDRAIVLRDRESAIVYHNKGYALENKGNYKDAIKNYESALQRNPYQTVTAARLAHAYYVTGEYEKAVTMGEAVLENEPANKVVTPWLPDAKMKLAKEKEAMTARKQKEQVEKEHRQLEEKKASLLVREKERGVFYFTVDAMLRTGLFYGKQYHLGGLYYTTPHGYRVVTDKGLIVNIPYTIFLHLSPSPIVEFNLTVENPFLGSLMPEGIVVQCETFESLFHIRKAIIGAGAMFNHYDSDVAFFRRYKLWDYKAGIIVGYNDGAFKALITWYPRVLIMDPATSTGKSMDVGLLKLDWLYRLDQQIDLYGLIHARDYYVYNHSRDKYVAIDLAKDFLFYAPQAYVSAVNAIYLFDSDHLSDYWGVYDLGLGITLNDLLDRKDGVQLAVSIELIERFYLRDLMNKNPYTLAPNGQGWFGLNASKFTKGKPFSGFHAFSQVVGLRLEEQLGGGFFMYQKLIVELADQNSDHHEFNLRMGMGVRI
jgi:tetratricopeptide (TPR) repeat protein